jgi:uncharacterized protein YcbX
MGTSAAERKGSMSDSYAKVKKDAKSETASVKSRVQSASKSMSASASSASASISNAANNAGAKGKKMDRAEMDRIRENLKVRIEEEGKKGYKKVKTEVN